MKKCKLQIIALILARGGSQRLPRKNVMPLNGKPLISYTIKDALRSKWIDRVIVSTDDAEIVRVAKKFGAEVPFVRPKALAGGKVSDLPVCAHAVEWLSKFDSYQADILVLLRPTTPLRSKGLIDRCIERLITSGGDSVRSVRSVGHWHPYWMLKLEKRNRVREFIPGKKVDQYYQSQLLPPVYKHDAYCDVIRVRNLPKKYSPRTGLQGFYGKDRRVYINEDPCFINIDTAEEMEYAKLMMRKLKRR